MAKNQNNAIFSPLSEELYQRYANGTITKKELVYRFYQLVKCKDVDAFPSSWEEVEEFIPYGIAELSFGTVSVMVLAPLIQRRLKKVYDKERK